MVKTVALQLTTNHGGITAGNPAQQPPIEDGWAPDWERTQPPRPAVASVTTGDTVQR